MMKKTLPELNLEKLRHKNRMEEIKFEFECKKKIWATKHQDDLETHRIKNADIQRSIARRQHTRY